LKKGDIKFTLDGYKLKGSWVLVRTSGGYGRGGGDSRSWLLIKHRDDWAGDVDITEFAPRSVKSDGELEDILAADNPDVWVSNRPAEGGTAGEMLATIIKRAAALKAGRAVDRKSAAKSDTATSKRKTAAAKQPKQATTRPARKPAAKTAARPRPSARKARA
jgi:bifunctional non-homologous end joining protein LigD